MELKVDKEYWIKAKFLGELSKSPNDGPYIPKRRYAFRVGNRETSIDFSLVDFEVIEALPETEKVTIPKFVADWIEACKRDGDVLAFVLEGDYDTAEWLETEGNEELLARAYLDGYEVEKEPLYTVEIPDPYSAFYRVVLYRNNNGNVVIVRLNFNDWEKQDEYKLTEEEIKQNHEWAWQWAKPVEE